MKKRIREIYKCLDARLYEAALALSLTLPDICGQVEYPDLGVAARYKKWVDNYIDKIKMGCNCEGWKNSGIDESVTAGERYPVFTSTNLYKLRCSFLHSGNDDIESDFMEFELVQPGSSKLVDYDGHIVAYAGTISMREEKTTFSFVIDIDYLCKLLCESAENYMNSKDEELFHSHVFSLN